MALLESRDRPLRTTASGMASQFNIRALVRFKRRTDLRRVRAVDANVDTDR